MKTITELNNKIWYRLVKVIFISLAGISAIISTAINFDNVGNYQNDYNVICNYGNKSGFLAYKDKNIYISSDEDYSYSLAELPNSTKKELQAACAISEEEMGLIIDSFFRGEHDTKKVYDITKYWNRISKC